MTRYLRNQSVLAAMETTYGSLQSMVAADAVLLKNVSVTIPTDGDPRSLIRGFMGGSEILVGAKPIMLEFSVELAGGGAAGTVPPWGKLARACGMSETITAASRVEYGCSSTLFDGCSFAFANDGYKYTARGGRGNLKLNMSTYKAPTLDFSFTCFDYTHVAAANPAPTFSAYQRPLPAADGNSTVVKLGGTYATGVISGGTTVITRELGFDLGNSVTHMKMLGSESVDITDREVVGSITAFLSTTDESSWRTDIGANTLATFGFSHGTTAGNKIAVFAGSTQRLNGKVADYEGRIMMGADLRCLPTGAGNNEFLLVAL